MYPTHQKARPRQEIGGCKERIQNSIESTSLTKIVPTRSFSDQSPTPEEGDLGGGSDLNNGECHRLR